MIDQKQETQEALSQNIHLLPEHLVDQIKAGEVIERPASLIKEVIENSLDAKPSEINIHIINNGLDLIAIEDDGHGMSYSDLPYAFCRHATSKISHFEDLYNLHSFGFRGEALASIAAIAKVSCSSSPAENHKEGGKIIFHAGLNKAHEHQQNLRKGTSLYIKDLFFNTPARLKFIKSAQSEKNALKRTIDSFILANPHIKFTIKWDEQDKEVFLPTQDQSERVAKLFEGRKKDPEVYSFSGEYEGHQVWGYLSQKSSKGNAHKKQFLYGNQRLFTDRQIHQTILRSSEGIYPPGESGHYCIFLQVPERLIDVNVHPNKTQIKFFKLSVLTALLSSEIKKISATLKQKREEALPSSSPLLPSSPTPQQEGDIFRHTPRTKDNFQPSSWPIDLTEKRSPFQLIELEKSYLLSKERLVAFIRTKLEHAQFNHDQDFIPLMICEPLEVNDSHGPLPPDLIPMLEKRGLQCELLNDNDERNPVLVLKGYHHIYNGLSQIEKFAQLCCHSLMSTEEADYNEIHISPHWLSKLLEKYPHEYHNFCLPLDDSFLKKNFLGEY